MGDREESTATAQERRASLLLGFGAFVGLLAAAVSVLSSGDTRIPQLGSDTVALVNGEPIRRADYERLVAGLARDSRNPIDDEARKHVLDRMIEEELLVQRALDLGLAKVDRRVRSNLTSSLIQSVVTGAEGREPEPEELEAFYADNRDFFTQPGRLKVRQVFFRLGKGDEAEAIERAEEARAALLSGTPFDEVRAAHGDEVVSPIPFAMLPPTKLREYIGPGALSVGETLAEGEVSAPTRSGVGVHLLQLVERQPAITPPFDTIEPQVRVEFIRRAGDQALRDYLDALRDDSEVIIRD